ncbi:tetratricopeptide repeat protein [Pseudomarimonas arenosa]|uniref:Tetratricopeptide repeat protein n=1 Tax=Pseudomarimonas arenosa TaxID=2774145 RepID=A0AAW3ZJI7_9GAMM|nr:tetratricopeptide repeat protein [Pseudomarimonas arenosa]MBD8524879.1 tetratricopeptide repeat protein [Pseudomarimonas arenosa]
MSAEVTVIVPTYDHADTLHESIGSVRRQSFSDLEIVIIGDGVTEATRRVALDLCAQDSRIVFREFPKSARTGEPYRDQVIRESSSPYILYQSDDDLWLEHHVTTLRSALQRADFVHSLHVAVDVDGTLTALLGSLKSDDMRAMLRNRRANLFGLPFAAHRRTAYLSLEQGWTTTPVGCWTDLYMWSKWMALPSERLASVLQPTALHFPSPYRGNWPEARRRQELSEWVRRLEQAGPAMIQARLHFQVGPLLNALRDKHFDSLDALLDHSRIEIDRGADAVSECDSGESMMSSRCTMLEAQLEELSLGFQQSSGVSNWQDLAARWRLRFESRPACSYATARLCAALNAMGQFDQAVDVAESVLGGTEIVAGTQHADLMVSYSQALAARGKDERAAQLLRAELELAPKNAVLRGGLARLLLRSGREDEAIEVYKEALSADRNVGRAPLTGLVNLLLQLQRFQQAEAYALTLAERNPDQSAVWLALAKCADARRDFVSCLSLLDRAGSLAPRLPTNYYLIRARALQELGRVDQAMTVLSTGLQFHPRHRGLQAAQAQLAA